MLLEARRHARQAHPAGRSREVLVGHDLHAALDLAHRAEIVVEPRPIRGVELAADRCGALGHEVEQAAGLSDDRFALRARIALAEQPVVELARVVLHRQGLRGLRNEIVDPKPQPNSGCTLRRSPAFVSTHSSSDGNGVSCPICCATIWSAEVPLELVPSFGQNGDLQLSHVPGLTEWTPAPSAALLRRPLTTVIWSLKAERREDLRQLETAARRRRHPAVDDGAVREIEETRSSASARRRSARAQCRPGSSRRAEAAIATRRAREERSAWQVLFRDEHVELYDCACSARLDPYSAIALADNVSRSAAAGAFIWNCALFTIPSTIAENR